MIAYILPYHNEQKRITAVIHGTADEDEPGPSYWVKTKGVLLNISGESDNLLMTRFGGRFHKEEVSFKKTDVVRQIFHPAPSKGATRY